MRRLRPRRAAFFVIAGVLLPLFACGTSAIGVDICNQIEGARCTRAASIDGGCGIDFMAPFSDGSAATPAENAATCIRYYTVACLHGLVTPDLPSTTTTNDQVTSCIDTINTGSCAVVLNPQEASTCLWLAEGGVDAEGGTPADTATPADAGTDAIADADTGAADRGTLP